MPTEKDRDNFIIRPTAEQHLAESVDHQRIVDLLIEKQLTEITELRKAVEELTKQLQAETEEHNRTINQLMEQYQAEIAEYKEKIEKLTGQKEAEHEENKVTVAGLQENIKNLNQTIVNLQETIAGLNRKLFGKSSEKTAASEKKEETSTDKEVGTGDTKTEKTEDDKEKGGSDNVSSDNTEMVTVETGKETWVNGHFRKPGKKSLRKDLYESLPVMKVFIDAKGKERLCPDDGAEMEHLSYEYAREELRIYPAKIVRVQIYREKMKCPVCEEEMVTTIVAGPYPKPLLPHSPASASSVAYVMYEKSCMHMPFYRQELDWKEHGVPVPRETQANWYNSCAIKYLKPVYDMLHEELKKREVLHADEVPCQVLHEKDRKPESKSYMWIYLTGTDGLPGIVLYQYCAGRSGDYPIEFLEGFKGMLHCDGYAAYGRIEDVILVCCLAHARRKFFDAIPANRRKSFKLLDINSEEEIQEPKTDEESQKNLLPAEKGVIYCNRIFYRERIYKDLDADERKNRRNETEPQIWNEFWTWLETLNPTGGSKLEKAVNYAQNHKETLMNYLKDGRCQVSNNAAERRAKSYATGRKNFLFHDTTDGANASAIVLSLIETAKANKLNIFQYLYTLLLYMPDYLEEPAGIEQLMPWSDFIKEHCSGQADVESNTIENRDELPIRNNSVKVSDE